MVESLGLRVTRSAWGQAGSLPLHLSAAAGYELCRCDGRDFVVALPGAGESLPECKRIVAQVSQHTSLPVVLASEDMDPRQRRALVAQGIPVIVPGKLAYLPFLGLAAQEVAQQRALGGRLSPRAQAALVAIIANPKISTSSELREVTRMSASSVSRAVDELARRGLIARGKEGRDVTFAYDRSRNALLRRARPLLMSPVVSVRFVRRAGNLEALPDAGETALAARSMLAEPPIHQKAVAKGRLAELGMEEVLEGELADEETVELQVWAYDPLVAGLGHIDDVSLALSLADMADERVEGELDELFGEEGLWQ